MPTESVTISVPTELIDLIRHESNGNVSRFFVQGAKRQIMWSKNYGAVREVYLELAKEQETGETERISFNCPQWLKRRLERHLDHLVMNLDGFMANCISKYLVNKEFDSPSPALSPLAAALVRRFENQEAQTYEGILP